ncbi:MAG: alpha-amylase family glycosyl hydrolase [Myxococcota bacterium]
MRRGLLIVFLAGCTSAPRETAITTNVDDWRDEIIYQVMVDRFENGDRSNDTLNGVDIDPSDLTRHQGGDWRGLRQRLDYIADLGATAIWISPIVANVDRTPPEDGYHGYWGADFTTVNPRFGSLEDLQDLVEAAHRRDLKVIIDVVPNHAGRVFAYDLNENGVVDEGEWEPPFQESAYEVPLLWVERPRLFFEEGILELGREHFRRRGRGEFSMPGGKVFGDFPTGLRDLDTERDDVRRALVDTYVRWVRETNVDGFRIDAVPHIEDSFWPFFGAEVRARLAALGKRRFLLLGEVFSGDPRELARFSGETGSLDAAFDFGLKLDVIDGVILEGRAANTAARALEESQSLFRPFGHPQGVGVGPWQARVGIADNHDTWRLRGELDRFDAAALALLVVATVDAIPCIYYGTEQAFRGQGGAASRERMWDSGFSRRTPTYLWLQQLLALRRELPVLRRGDLRVRYASSEDGFSDAADAGMLAYERALEDERVLVVLNAHALKTSSAPVPSGFPRGTVLVDQLSAATAIVGEGGLVEAELGPREARIWARRDLGGESR